MEVRVLEQAQAHLETIRLDPDAAEQMQKTLEQAIGLAACGNGNRVLDSAEGQAIVAAYQQVVGEDGHLDASKSAAFIDAVKAQTSTLQLQQPKSTEVCFTSEGDGLKVFRSKVLGPMQEVIAKAAGREVAFNVMIFSFTDGEIADGILQLARENPNVTFRMIADWSQLSTTGDKQARRIAAVAQAEGLTNVQVKIKKDNPYVWSQSRQEPIYLHAATQGLNHHKGYVALIDGRPEKLVTGSYNWSVSGARSNHENVMVLDRADSDNRPILGSYQEEFEAFWNNDDAALTVSEAFAEQERIYQQLHAENGSVYTPGSIASEIWDDIEYDATNNSRAFDINSLSDEDSAALTALMGGTLKETIQSELNTYGRFASWTELLVRVPELAALPTWQREPLRVLAEYGDGGLSINSATVSELRRAGLSRLQAKSLVGFRNAHGAFESLNEIDDVSWIGGRTIDKVRNTLTDDGNVACYSGKVPGGETGYGFANTHSRIMSVPTRGATEAYRPSYGRVVPPNRGEQSEVEANLASVVKDMLRRAEPGQTFRMAMYGMSTSSQEFAELKDAIERGVAVRVIIYDSYNEGAIEKLKEFRRSGYDVDLRVISSKVMHEKFGVVGDDVFNGSANWSSSSITKHAEDRFLFRNMPNLAQRFVEEFNRLWESGNLAAHRTPMGTGVRLRSGGTVA